MFGCIPDLAHDVAEDLEQRHVGRLVGARVSELPTVIDYSGLIDRVADQGGTNSCVGQALATAIYVRAQIAGFAIDKPSAKAIYDVARLADSPHVLIDEGSRARAAIDGCHEYGLVAESRWPLTEANVNQPPPLDVFRAGAGAKLEAHYRIGGGDIATLVRVALAKGFVPVFAMQVDDAYLAYGGADVYRGLTSRAVGSHMQAIVGYGANYVLVANSWGRGWGAGGFARIAPDFLNSAAVFDVLVPTVVPTQVT